MGQSAGLPGCAPTMKWCLKATPSDPRALTNAPRLRGYLDSCPKLGSSYAAKRVRPAVLSAYLGAGPRLRLLDAATLDDCWRACPCCLRRRPRLFALRGGDRKPRARTSSSAFSAESAMRSRFQSAIQSSGAWPVSRSKAARRSARDAIADGRWASGRFPFRRRRYESSASRETNVFRSDTRTALSFPRRMSLYTPSALISSSSATCETVR
jgi:hypothetical protein